MGQQESKYQPPSARNYHFPHKVSRLEYEGVLKLRSTPFPNCVQIQTDNETLFLEDAQMSLADLLNSRYYTNRLFLCEDIEKLIEGISYTLAYFQQNKLNYKDLASQNIYYSAGTFKLLPNQLIQETTYQRSQAYLQNSRQKHQTQQPDFPYLSPQLVIALRYKEPTVDDFQLLQKTNVFLLGMILLQCTSLMPSKECYDPSTYDIYNTIIEERLEIIEGHYNEKIARIIGNMLDYDYTERMNPKTLSIWINRELASEKQDLKNSAFSSEKLKNKSNLSRSTLKKSSPRVIPVQPQIEETKPPVKNYSRSNLVYMNGDYQEDEQFEQNYRGGPKNKIYLEKVMSQDNFINEEKNRIQKMENKFDLAYEPYEYERSKKNDHKFDKKSYYPHEKVYTKEYERDENRKQRNIYEENLRQNHQIDYLPTANHHQQSRANVYTHENQIPHNPKLNKNPYYNPQPKQETQALKIKSMNKYFPDIEQLEKGKTTETKRVAKHVQVGKNSRGKEVYESQSSGRLVNDTSINRIKVEIEKSRKLIEQFRKNEGINPV